MDKHQQASERGAALVTMLMISTLMLIAGGALIMTTSMTATNSADSSAETQAYYAAEAGAQSVLHVLRGNVPPTPLFTPNPSGSIAPQNQISFSRAVATSTSNVSGDSTSTARLSRWLTYSSTYPDRVTLTDGYSPINGMAYGAIISDPDNSSHVVFSTSGTFDNGTATKTFGSGNTRVTLTYQAQGSTTIDTSGSSTLGAIDISNVGSSGNTSSNVPFTLRITQTLPFAYSYSINCTLSWSINNGNPNNVVTVTFPTLSNSLLGTNFTRTTTTPTTNGSTYIPITVTAPEPNRVLVKINGYGPRASLKQMQMLVSRFAFDYTAPSMITLRSADDNSVCTFNAGSSSQYLYNGYDSAGGLNLAAFGVTSTPDYNYLTSLSLPAGQVFGTPSGVQQVAVSSLPTFLQTADAAREFVAQMRTTSINENRYFTTASPPSSFGTPSQPLLTFVDGDADLSPAGGAGLMVVTGTMYLRGSSEFKGLILVLGGGQIIRDGGGNGDSFGAVLVARFGSSGNFLAPNFYSDGSGTSNIQYDSEWVRRALGVTGPRSLGISEY